MSRLIDAADEGRLAEDELLSNTGLLLLAGFETTTSLIANAVYQLIAHPEQRAKLIAQPELIRSAIEEVLRFDGPTHMMRPRTIIHDVRIGDAELKSGDAVVPIIASADRDEAEFENASTFDITRTENRHLGFGLGHHVCVGAGFARLEAQVAVSHLFERFPNVALAADAEPVIRPNLAVRGFEKLPVVLE